ncbi:MAG: 50S ribosomal protein L6 [Desulfobacterales bacterium]|nr:50S ribosomal protein L6 [Desulfobacterales bacterium]MDD4070795.1 50S ribosomal protein L6 [Desulfobacterales bacterium]MDD4391197.1 50S ribosomal protein L6 [Desulfobacterales bacterium]
MSRIGKKPISIPDNVKISYKDRFLTVQGEKGKMSRTIHPFIDLNINQDVLLVVMEKKDRINNAMQGLTRSLVFNMINGVSKGFERILQINGIGYRAEISGNSIVFNIGYSNPVTFSIPEGITATIDRNTIIKLAGIDKELLGQTAASIRRLRPPEPYKGKGIKFAEEFIQRKAGKTGTK